MTFLTLTFYDDHFQSDFFRIDWPNDKPLTRARISPQKMKGLVYTDLIMLNRSTSERVFFATGTQLIKEHEKMKRVLKSLGEPFDEHVSVRKEVTVGFFRRRTIPKKVGLLIGSTANPETIGKIFDSYVSWHALSWPFAFVVADREPPGWKSQIGPLVSLSTVAGKPSMPAFLIENSHAIMVTEFEYSIIFLSDKIGRKQLIDVGTEIAKRHSLDLSVEENREFDQNTKAIPRMNKQDVSTC